jgi:lipopolysaccharide export LptBFGC system permease protein LptF
MNLTRGENSMKKKWLSRVMAVALFAALLSFGCAQKAPEGGQAAKPATAEAKAQSKNVYTGSVVGKSNKAKTISIEVGKGADAKTMMVRFDDKTKGLEFAETGEAAIINWEQRGDDKFATTIKPKLATLPEGVTEIGVEELNKLISQNAPFTLADARPKARYDQAHLPGAISIPVPALEEKKEAILPKDKDKLLIFYCGGYT